MGLLTAPSESDDKHTTNPSGRVRAPSEGEWESSCCAKVLQHKLTGKEVKQRRMSTVNIGIDVGKHSCVATVKGESTLVLFEDKFQRTTLGIRSLTERVTGPRIQGACRVDGKLLDRSP